MGVGIGAGPWLPFRASELRRRCTWAGRSLADPPPPPPLRRGTRPSFSDVFTDPLTLRDRVKRSPARGKIRKRLRGYSAACPVARLPSLGAAGPLEGPDRPGLPGTRRASRAGQERRTGGERRASKHKVYRKPLKQRSDCVFRHTVSPGSTEACLHSLGRDSPPPPSLDPRCTDCLGRLPALRPSERPFWISFQTEPAPFDGSTRDDDRQRGGRKCLQKQFGRFLLLFLFDVFFLLCAWGPGFDWRFLAEQKTSHLFLTATYLSLHRPLF